MPKSRPADAPLASFMDEWETESGPPDPDSVAAMRERFFAER
ncbi:hypothetical protein [Candidatus Poriferisodalis sp.]